MKLSLGVLLLLLFLYFPLTSSILLFKLTTKLQNNDENLSTQFHILYFLFYVRNYLLNKKEKKKKSIKNSLKSFAARTAVVIKKNIYIYI